VPSPSRSHTETLHAYLKQSVVAKFPPVSASEGRATTQAASDALGALLADLQRLEEALEQVRESEMGTNQAHRIANAALAALHREKPDSRD
jgi:hypothetical protein